MPFNARQNANLSNGICDKKKKKGHQTDLSKNILK